MKKIYVTTNLFRVSESAMFYAAELARQTGAELTVIHAYHLIPYYSDFYASKQREQLEAIREESDAKLREWCESKASSGEFNYRIINREGLPREVIVDAVNQSPPDLLIMGTRTTWLIDKVLFGSKTGEVLAEIDCPLLVVPEDTPYSHFSNIAVASDFLFADLTTIEKLVDIAKPVKGTINVFHVLNKDASTNKDEAEYFDEFKNEIQNRIDYANITFKLVHGHNFVKTINEYTESTGANLLVMSQTDKNWFARLFNPSVTKKRFYRMTIPTLFFKAHDNEAESDF